MTTQSWALALAELIYYIPSTIPVLYLLCRHRKHPLGWLCLFAFASLQIIGSGMALSAGRHGRPSATAITLTSVGMSPLMLAIAGVVHEWIDICGLLTSSKSRKWAWVVAIAYHIAVAGAIAIYAVGSSNASDLAGDEAAIEMGKTLSKAGVVVLILLWLVLDIVFGVMVWKVRPAVPCRSFLWSIVISLALLGVRLIYATVATFNDRVGVFDPLTGSIALKVIFEFLPGALIVSAMVTGGILSLEKVGAY